MQAALSLSGLINGIVSIIFSFAILFNNRKSIINRTLFLLTMATAFWSLAYWRWLLIYHDASAALFWVRILSIFSSLIPVFFLHWIISLLGLNQRNKKIIILFYIVTALFLGFGFSDLFVSGVVSTLQFAFWPWGGPLYHIYILTYLLIFIYCLWLMVDYYRHCSDLNKRRQLRMVFIGSAMGFCGGATNFLLWYGIPIPPLGNFIVILYVFIFGYAIFRYHLMNIKIIVRLSAIYSVVFALIAGIYAIVNSLLVNLFHITYFWGYLLLALIITIGFIPLNNVVTNFVDRLFFKNHYKFTDIVAKIQRAIHDAGLDLDKALSSINELIITALKVEGGAILIMSSENQFISRQIVDGRSSVGLEYGSPIIGYLKNNLDGLISREDIEQGIYHKIGYENSLQDAVVELKMLGYSLAAPIGRGNQLIGVYLIGSKKSGAMFSEEDLELVRHVTWEMSFTIDIAHSYEELKRLDEAKSNFVDVVSHQMRTPVTIGRCNLELAMDKGLPKKDQAAAIAAAYEGTVSLGRQLDQLLTVLDIEEQKLIIEKQPLNMNNLINRVVKNSLDPIKQKKLKVKLNLPDPATPVAGDETKIAKVFDTILANAISYTPDGGKIDVSVSSQAADGKNRLVVAVADSGVGVQTNDHQDMFKKFFRSAEAKKMSPNGFGLDLYIAQQFIKAHGGDIWFENGAVKGTTFYFSLPL